MRTKLLGVVFLALVLSGIWATYGVFTKKFTDYDEVTLLSSKLGLQLPERADVKIRGVIVGEVTDFRATGDGAELTLGLFPDMREIVPADVTGRIVPKTLFGEKYVSLEVPATPSTEAIQEGATIERTEVSIEVERVLSDLLPLLRTVQPIQLNNTLNALSTALEGRGDQLGGNIETLDSYLRRINPEIPGLVEDLRLTAQVSDLYADVVPELASFLDDQITTLGTLEDREQVLEALFTDVARFSGTTREFLARNERNLIRVSQLGEPQLALLEKYAPGTTCLLDGIVDQAPLLAQTFRGYTLHINLEVLPNQPRRYTEQDRPRLGAENGPYCGRLVNPPYDQDNVFNDIPNFDDGVDEPTGKGTTRVATGFDAPAAPVAGTTAGAVPSSLGGVWAGTRVESDLLKSLLAPVMGLSAEAVPDLGVLLVGPMARGAEVELR